MIWIQHISGAGRKYKSKLVVEDSWRSVCTSQYSRGIDTVSINPI